MQLFVTGGTGFIGSHFLRQALSAGHHVRALRRPGSQPRLTLPAEPEWIDAASTLTSCDQMHGCDALVHFASVGVSPQHATWQEMLHFNVITQMTLLDAARRAGIRRLVLAGSSAEYGLSAERYVRIPTTAPLLPTSGYAASKAAGFEAAYGYAVEHALELCYLRIFSAFGEGQFEKNFWPSLRRAALSGSDFDMTPGEQIRDYVQVGAVAKVFLAAIARTDVVAGYPLIENVGSGEALTTRAFAERCWNDWEATGSLKVGALRYRSGEVMRFVPELPGEHSNDTDTVSTQQ